jgi:RNA polymerase sigma-54 factor
MKATMQLRMSQHLALTPQLQQSIRLLQLSTLELHQEVQQMLDDNPFLEIDEDAASAYEQPLDSAQREAPPRELAREQERAAEPQPEPSAEADGSGLEELGASSFEGHTEREDWANGTEGEDFDGVRELPVLQAPTAASGGDDESDPLERRAVAGVGSLREHLLAQLPELPLQGEDRAALQVLIESLDDDGYLEEPLEEITQRLAQDLGMAVDGDAYEDLASRLRCARHWLQRLEPAGVGAQGLAECLSLQLQRQREACRSQRQPQPAALELALALCAQHLETLAKRDFKRLMAATGADEAQLKSAHALILRCEPKPGRAFGLDLSPPIVPDVVVQRAGRQWRVVLNPDAAPRLRIHDQYAGALKAQRGASTTAFGARLQEARWFIRNIQQRFDTILRVSEAIVERQRGFFTHGAIAMKPLVLREIADELGLHESTISRVTTAKYMATPLGTFELKYFFGSGLATETGGNASSTAVRALIQQLVAAENGQAPLSDSSLAQMLEAQGIQVARRTVAKYREALKIAPANLRRSL